MTSKMMSNQHLRRPFLGFGLGLRRQHYATIVEEKPAVDWFEIISENYMAEGGKPLYYLDKIRADYPMVMHGVSMSLGSADPLNLNYLADLKKLADRVQPVWISDHLCWTGVNGLNTHDLLPMPYTEEALRHMVGRVQQAQEFLGRRLLIENPSSYVAFSDSPIPEWEFLATLANEADCLLLLDINNVYVSAFNHGFDAVRYIDHMPSERVYQFHLAGHLNRGDYIIDTHDHPVIDPVWELYRHAVARFGPVSTMIERDDDIPPLADLLDELAIAKRIAEPWKLAA